MNWVASIISWFICVFVTVASIAITVILWMTYYDVSQEKQRDVGYSQFEEFIRNENALYAMAIIASIVVVSIEMRTHSPVPIHGGENRKFIYVMLTIHRCSLLLRFAWCESGSVDWLRCSKRRPIVCYRCRVWLDHRWLLLLFWHCFCHSGWPLSCVLPRPTIRAWNRYCQPHWHRTLPKRDLHLANHWLSKITAKWIISRSVWSNIKMFTGCVTCCGFIWLAWFGRANLFLVSRLAYARHVNWE